MNIAQIANSTLALTIPFLPALLPIGNAMSEEMAKKLGEEIGEGSWGLAKKLWVKISNSEYATQTTKSAKVVAEHPERKAYNDILQEDLIAQLEKDIDLVTQLRKLLKEDSQVFQKVYAKNQSSIIDIEQISDATSEQSIIAEDKSTIIGVKQIVK